MELDTELTRLRPSDDPRDRADPDDVDRHRIARRDRAVALDQRAHRRDVAQADFEWLAVDRRDRAPHQPLARFAGRLKAVGGDAGLGGEFERVGGGHRLAEDIALDLADPEFADEAQIVVGLDPLRRGIHVETLGERDDGADDRGIAVRGRGRAADEALVDLDLVERRLAQVAERRIAGPEIVEREPHAERLEPREGVVGGVAGGQEHALGDLEFEPLGAQFVFGERGGDDVDDRRVVELDRRQVDRDAHRIRPFGGFGKRGLEHELADLADHPALFGERDELVGGDRAAGRVAPPHQRLEPRQILARGADDRLERDPQFVAIERLAEIVVEHLAIRRLAVHRGLVEHMLAAPGGLGGIKREIGVADQAVGAILLRVADRDPDRGADGDPVALDQIGARDLLDQRPREALEQPGLDRARKHGLELVPAQSPDLAMVAHDAGQPLPDQPQQGVPDRMAKRVVDVLEPVEVDQEQGAALLPPRRIAQRLVERLAHQRAVGQAGERIEPRQAADLLFGPALFGEVGADPAEPQEAPARVEHRIARQRPMDVLGAGGADDDVAERKACRQVKTEGALFAHDIADIAVDRQQVGELAPEQRFGIGVEVVGELLRDVGQGALVIGFPEPAATAVFELVDEMQGFARFLVEAEAGAGGRDHGPRGQRAEPDQHQRQHHDRAGEGGIAAEQDRSADPDHGADQCHRGGPDRDHCAGGDRGSDQHVEQRAMGHRRQGRDVATEHRHQRARDPDQRYQRQRRRSRLQLEPIAHPQHRDRRDVAQQGAGDGGEDAEQGAIVELLITMQRDRRAAQEMDRQQQRRDMIERGNPQTGDFLALLVLVSARIEQQGVGQPVFTRHLRHRYRLGKSASTHPLLPCEETTG